MATRLNPALSALEPEIRHALEAVAGGTVAAELESETLDFKEEDRRSRGDTEKLMRDAALCFANHIGGAVVLGVNNKKGGPDAFVGTSLSAGDLKKRIYELTEPPLLVDVTPVTFQGVDLLVVRVPESPEIHADKQGRAPRRVNTDCLPMSPQDQVRLREERLGVDLSAKATNRSLKDISPQALALAREHLGRGTAARRRFADLDDEEMLRQLGLLTENDRLTRAGEALLCAPRDGRTPRVVYHYRDTPGGEPRATERLIAPMLVAYQRVLELVAARRIETSVSLPNGQELTIEDFPSRALEEALANALIHGDLHQTMPVMIDHSPQVLSVSSPGPLVSGVTPQNILTHRSKPRNRRLAEAARALRLAEEVGQGVDRMYREMIASGKEIPAIESTTEVTVTFVGGAPNKRVAAYVAQLPEQEREDVDTLLTLLRLCSTKTTNAGDMASRMQKPVEAAEQVLRRLAGDEVAMIEPTRGTLKRANPKYRLRDDVIRTLGTAVQYNVRTTDEIDRKVIAHVREYGRITNKTVRNLFDVDVHRAKDILGDLVKRDVLAKTGTGKRGPLVAYEPGVAFPAEGNGLRRRSSGSGAQTSIPVDDTEK
jgi:ATP-dependent DNA helicase RecG